MDSVNGCLKSESDNYSLDRFFLDVVLLSTLHHTLTDRQEGEIEQSLSFFATKGVASSPVLFVALLPDLIEVTIL